MIDTNTTLFGLIGNPVAHSLGPLLHNQALTAAGHNGIYLSFRVIDLDAAIKGIRALGLKGISVTIPHKVAIMQYLDAVDETAAKIGAVNTLVNTNGKLTGYNTDCFGALEALKTKTGIDGKSVAILGAGGAARAIGFGLVSAGAKVTILNRSIEGGQHLADDLQAEFLPLFKWKPGSHEILINTTPVGMQPLTNATPIPETTLSKDILVMDIVYNPLKTRLLQAAEKCDCETIDGSLMFVLQAARQFELWTGMKAPVETMRHTVLKALKTK